MQPKPFTGESPTKKELALSTEAKNFIAAKAEDVVAIAQACNQYDDFPIFDDPTDPSSPVDWEQITRNDNDWNQQMGEEELAVARQFLGLSKDKRPFLFIQVKNAALLSAQERYPLEEGSSASDIERREHQIAILQSYIRTVLERIFRYILMAKRSEKDA